MKCDQVEDLLPGYFGGDLSEEEKLLVDKHLAGCALCRESCTVYSDLERHLVDLKSEMPLPAAVYGGVAARLGLRKKRISPAAIWNAPFVTGLVTAICALILFVYREPLKELYPGVTAAVSRIVSDFSTFLPEWIVHASGGETWVLYCVYLLLAFLTILIGGLTLNRFIHE
jgi:hypothetical protein